MNVELLENVTLPKRKEQFICDTYLPIDLKTIGQNKRSWIDTQIRG